MAFSESPHTMSRALALRSCVVAWPDTRSITCEEPVPLAATATATPISTAVATANAISVRPTCSLARQASTPKETAPTTAPIHAARVNVMNSAVATKTQQPKRTYRHPVRDSSSASPSEANNARTMKLPNMSGLPMVANTRRYDHMS